MTPAANAASELARESGEARPWCLIPGLMYNDRGHHRPALLMLKQADLPEDSCNGRMDGLQADLTGSGQLRHKIAVRDRPSFARKPLQTPSHPVPGRLPLAR